MRVWYQLLNFDVSGISLANKIIQIAKLALGISEQNFQKTAIVPRREIYEVKLWTRVGGGQKMPKTVNVVYERPLSSYTPFRKVPKLLSTEAMVVLFYL